jgi:hypothetical protein
LSIGIERSRDDATRAIEWLMARVVEAIEDGDPPTE